MLAHLYVGGIWLFSLLLASPNMMATSYSETNETAKCSVDWSVMDDWLPADYASSELTKSSGNFSVTVQDDLSSTELYLQNLTHQERPQQAYRIKT